MLCWNEDSSTLTNGTGFCINFNIEDPERTKEVRIIFDSGSQRSYITDRVKQYLSLKSIHTETMVIKTFGSESQAKQTCDVVKLGVKLRSGGSMELLFLSVPLICEPLSSQPIALATNIYSKFASLELADYSYGNETLEIDGLIGSDQYWKIVTGEVICQHDGPTAVHTRMGWVNIIWTSPGCVTSSIFSEPCFNPCLGS